MAKLLALVFLLAGCNWTFDSDAPAFPLLGSPPLESSLVKLNDGPVYLSAIVLGTDNQPWLALQEDKASIKLRNLGPAGGTQTLMGDQFIIRYRAFYTWVHGPEPTDGSPRADKLQISSAGQTTPPNEFDFPLGAGALVVGGNEAVLIYAPLQTVMTVDHATVYRTDHSFQRDVPLPDVESAQTLGGTFFNGDGSLYFDKARCSEGCASASDVDNADRGGTERRVLTGHSTTSNVDYPLGPQPRRLLYYEPSVAKRQFITCGSNGLDVVPLVPSADNPARVLDDAACASPFFQYLRLTNTDGTTTLYLYYMIGEELRRVPVDGSAPPARAFDRDIVRVLGVGGDQTVLYSQDPDNKYIYGVGDGWIGDWRFANRGRLFYLSGDHKKMRWLENAAQGGGIGELRSAPIGGASTALARNVYDYDELDGGRLLAAANHAYRGTQNRIVVIDDTHKEARWVADRADDYSFIPGSTDLLVDIVTGASTSDLVRVPLPPDPYAAVDGGTD
ncbi:MAG: hypothetical protein ABI321_07645 [Polyangia bacterium]